jgi:predicted O-methyltransferase YrrM
MNTIPIFNKYTRALKAVALGIRYPALTRQFIKDALRCLYCEGNFKMKSLPKIALDELIQGNSEIILKNFNIREGNISAYELLVIASLISLRQPVNLLEIGTFDGNTTLQMAVNAPSRSVVHTIDLPDGETATAVPILQEDVKFVIDEKKKFRRYGGTLEEKNIEQHFGDSTTYDFAKFTTNGPIDFCFIDGGHSYECVKSDTEKALRILSEDAIVLWHDFNPNCPGVYSYLCQLSETAPIYHIEGTSLAIRLKK